MHFWPFIWYNFFPPEFCRLALSGSPLVTNSQFLSENAFILLLFQSVVKSIHFGFYFNFSIFLFLEPSRFFLNFLILAQLFFVIVFYDHVFKFLIALNIWNLLLYWYILNLTIPVPDVFVSLILLAVTLLVLFPSFFVYVWIN